MQGIAQQPASPYTAKRIAWELDRTAQGDAYYGNAIHVAMDIPGLSDADQMVLHRYAFGKAQGTDHVALQDIALRVFSAELSAEGVGA